MGMKGSGISMWRVLGCYLLAAGLGVARAQVTVPELYSPSETPASVAPDPPAPAGETAVATRPAPKAANTQDPESGRLNFKVDPEAYSILSSVKGLSTHRPSYVFPVTYSADYSGENTEMVFQISAKQRVFGSNFYVAYTQKSFWQYLNQDKSSPFRETNYGPELFYRWIPESRAFNRWAADFGLEHESNGRSIGESRSWNRLYIAPFHAKGKHLAYLKFWYRIPEGDASSETNPNGDDNPDLVDYVGHGELSYSQQIGGKQLLTGWLRGNPATGKGAIAFTWSIPSPGGYAFYGATVFHGYGESLIDYDTKITRLMIGLLLAR